MKIVLFLYHGNEDTDWPRLSVHWAVNVVVLLARAWFLVYAFCGQVLVSGNSMQPVLNADDAVLVNHPIRTMVLGIPNMGNSTFINSFAGEACTKTGNRPRDLVVCIGPSICKDCSEVVEAFRAVFGRQYWPELFCEKYLHHVQ